MLPRGAWLVDAEHRVHDAPGGSHQYIGSYLLIAANEVVHAVANPMIPATYALSGVLLLVTGALFAGGYLDAVTQTLAC